MTLLKASNVYNKGIGIEIDGTQLFFIREDGTRLLLAATPTEIVSGEQVIQVGISGYRDLDCMIVRNTVDNTIVFSLCDVNTNEVLESVDIQFDVFFLTK